MKIYSYSFLKNKKIPSNILSLLINIEKIRASGTINQDTYPKVFEKIQTIAMKQSVMYSNKIDNIGVSEIVLNAIISGKKDISNLNESLLNGYYESFQYILNNFNDIQLNSYEIRNIHYILFIKTQLENPGVYKNKDNVMIQHFIDGSNRVIFKSESSDLTSKSIEDLLEAYRTARDDEEIPNLLLIPCFILDFLLIFPFSNGSERVSRLLSLLLLFKNDYNVGKYISFEKQIFNNYDNYYDSIITSAFNWKNNDNDYYSFIEDFLNSLYLSYIELNSRFKIVEGKKVSKKTRIEETIKRSLYPISRKEINLIWPDIAQETIKKVIKNLLNDNKIKKIGKFKDARYKRNWYGNSTQNDENVVIF